MLTSDQICVCPTHPGNTVLDLENLVTDPKELAALCGSLFTVDKGSGVPLVRLAHVAVQGYICSDHLAGSNLGLFDMNPTKATLGIGVTRIRYVGFAIKCQELCFSAASHKRSDHGD